MRTFLAIVLGFVVGAAAAVLLAVAAYSLVPAVAVPTLPPSPPMALATPTPTALPAPSAGAGGSPSASALPTATAFALVGKPAPALVAPGLDGKQVDLRAYAGKAVWLDFTTTDCPSCREEYELMKGYASSYADAGLVVIAIHVKEDAATVRPFVDSLGITFPVALDEDGSRARAWDAAALPVQYWIDATGMVRAAALGRVGPDAMIENLSAILPGVTIGGE
ncbi:MAG TPA: redoxin domain-containing protein [Candidatus Limnocylindrales bacterium]|nr:redoxin domain-containing protein [Candidatus Limnocylindrales bacterium]